MASRYNKSPMSIPDIKATISRGIGWVSVAQRLGEPLSSFADQVGVAQDCPLHGGVNDMRAFNDFDTEGRLICSCCPSTIDVFDFLVESGMVQTLKLAREAVMDAAGLKASEGGQPRSTSLISNTPMQRKPKVRRASEEQIRNSLNALSRKSILARHAEAKPVKEYLNSRGLSFIPEGLRFARNVRANLDGRVETANAILAVVSRPDGSPVTFHRTFITDNGKKAFGGQSKMIHPCPVASDLMGSHITVYDNMGKVMNLTEGLENGIAVHEITFESVWSTRDTTGLQSVMLPEHVKHVRIWADRDPRISDRKVVVKEQDARDLIAKLEQGLPIGVTDLGIKSRVAQRPLGPGLEAALKAAMRFIAEGRTVEILMPGGSFEDKVDWLDVFVNELKSKPMEDRLKAAYFVADRQVTQLLKAA